MSSAVGAGGRLGAMTSWRPTGRGVEAAYGDHALAVTVLDPTPSGVGEMVARVARGAVSILINGETGTGKEVLAQTLHKLSGRTGELVAINCASLSESLLESELFGHERGAFTGAARAKPGLFEVAAGGMTAAGSRTAAALRT